MKRSHICHVLFMYCDFIIVNHSKEASDILNTFDDDVTDKSRRMEEHQQERHQASGDLYGFQALGSHGLHRICNHVLKLVNYW